MISDPRDDHAILTSKYSLVIAVAKRAREIVNRREQTVIPAHKPVFAALEEIDRGKIVITIKKEVVPVDEIGDNPKTADSQEAVLEQESGEPPEPKKPEQ